MPGVADHSVLRPAYGRQRNDEAGGLGAGGRDLPRRRLCAPGRRGADLQAAYGAGHDAVRAVPVLPPGAYLECAGRVPDPPLPAGAQPPLSLTPPPPPIASGGAIPIIPPPSAHSRRLVVNSLSQLCYVYASADGRRPVVADNKRYRLDERHFGT